MIYIKNSNLANLICICSLLALGLLISTSLASCLDLSASIGNSDGGSSLRIAYGAETIDSIEQEIMANADQGTISNEFSGTGSLPYGSLSKSDTRGNFVQVYRSISGKPGVTKWSYEWRTFSLLSSTDGYGVGAQLWLNAKNAYAIKCGSSSSSNAGGNVVAETKIVSSPDPISSIVNYYASSTAFPSQSAAYQSLSSAKGESIQILSKASDAGRSASAEINCNTESSLGSSSLDNSSSTATKTKDSAIAKLKFNSASGLKVCASLSASNPSKDKAQATADRCQDNKGIVTFSSFCGSSEYTNSYARADISSLKANLPVGGKMSVCMTASTTTYAGILCKCSVSTSFCGKANLLKFPYDTANWKSYSFASKSGGLVKAQQSGYGQSYQYTSGGTVRNSCFIFNAEASKSGYKNVKKEAIVYNKATKMYSYAEVRLTGAPDAAQGNLK